MKENHWIGVVVRDDEIRDLISLNLRFESFVTRNFDSLKSFLSSAKDAGLLILDVTGERQPRILVDSVRQRYGENFPLLLLSDRGTPSVEGEWELIIECINGRKRFDASVLISRIKEIFETHHDEPLKHPLTGLPAGAAVERYINNLITSGTDFAMISSDLDNMKAFNQRFGYARGDELLRGTVKLINDVLKDYPNKLNFVGHRGEDDFVVITSSDCAQSVGEKIVDLFDGMVGEFFSKTDLAHGYFTVNDRRGNELRFPLTTLSLVIINTDGRRFMHPAELYDVADEIMAEVKTRGINQSYCAVEKPNRNQEKENTLFFNF